MSFFEIQGHPFASHNRDSIRKGGLGAYVQSDFSVSILDDVSFWREGLLESLVLRLCKDGGEILHAVVQRPLSSPAAESLASLENLCNKLGCFRVPSVVVGDFNFNSLELSNVKNLEFLTAMLSADFLPSITSPTSVTSFSATQINNIFLPQIWYERLKFSGALVSPGSDHFQTPKTRRTIGNFSRQWETD